MSNNFKPESSDEIFKQEKFLVICPLKSNSDIFNEAKFEVRILPADLEEYRIVLLRKKPPEE